MKSTLSDLRISQWMSVLKRGKYVPEVGTATGTALSTGGDGGVELTRRRDGERGAVVARLEALDARLIRFGYSVLRPTERHYHAGDPRDDVFAQVTIQALSALTSSNLIESP